MSKKNITNGYTKAVDDTIRIPIKQGNGILKYSVSIDKKGKIVKYSFAYINFHLNPLDNGRVLGYDNSHGYHHRHYMGKEENVKFISYEEIADCFEKEWRMIHEKIKKQKNH